MQTPITEPQKLFVQQVHVLIPVAMLADEVRVVLVSIMGSVEIPPAEDLEITYDDIAEAFAVTWSY